MESLPFSRRTLLFTGIQISAKISRKTRCWNYFIRTFGILTMSALLSIPIYSILFGDTNWITSSAMLGMFVTNMASYVTLFSKKQKLFTVLEEALAQMDDSTIMKINCYDRRNGAFKVIFIMTMVTLFYAYLIVFGFQQEIVSLMLGLQSKPDTDLTLFVIPIALFFSSVLLYVLFLQFYTSLLFFASQFASLVHEKIVPADQSIDIDYEGIKKSLQLLNKLMQTINEEVGFLPLSLLGMEFIMFADGISFLVTSSGKIDVSPYFAILTVGSTNLLYIISLLRIINLSSEIQTTVFTGMENGRGIRFGSIRSGPNKRRHQNAQIIEILSHHGVCGSR